MNVAVTESKAEAAVTTPLRVAVVGIGWWSDVLADAIGRSNQIEVASCLPIRMMNFPSRVNLRICEGWPLLPTHRAPEP